MSDAEVIQLLREIRDLNQQHIQEYRDYLARHEKLAADQTAKFTRSMRVVMFVVLLLGVLLGVAVMSLAYRLATCSAWG